MLLRLQFFLQQYLARRLFEATTIGVVACSTVAALFFWITAPDVTAVSAAGLPNPHAVSKQTSSPISLPSETPQLPGFNSAKVAAQFHENAHAVGLASEEVGYTLDSPPGQPYQRYRIRFPVKADYARIRRFVAALAADMPHLALDGINCTRENTAAALLTCDLVFSAFFRLDSNE